MAYKKRDPESKAKLFQLFDEGKLPGDPEVKALGYKSNTIYRLRHEWESGGTATGGKLQTALGSGESIGGIDETKVKPITESKAETQGPKVKRASESKGVESEITEIADAEGKKNPTLPDFVNLIL